MKLVVAVVVLLVACKKNEKIETSEEVQARAKAELAADLSDAKRRGPGFAIKPDAPAAVEARPGPAYLALAEVGLVKLDGGKLSLIPGELRVVNDIVAGTDGAVYVIASEQVLRVAGDKLEPFGGKVEHALSGHGAIAPDGNLWFADTFAVWQWTGSAWQKHANVVPDKESIHSIAIDGKGRVYVGAKQMIVVYDGGAWKPVYDIREVFSRAGNEPPSYFTVRISPAGELIALHARGYLRFDGKDVQVVARDIQAPNFAGALTLHGTDVVAMSDERILRAPLGGGADKVTEEPKDASFGSEAVLDASGRVWMAPIDGGLTVVAADGTPSHFAPGALPELVASIKKIGVVGAGPELPKPAGELAKGSIKGVVTKAGAPIAKAPVEVCLRLRQEFGKDETPCSREKTRAQGTTDDKGGFQIDNLPLLDYGIAVEVEGQWYGLRGRACVGLAAGAVCDVGTLDVTNKPIF